MVNYLAHLASFGKHKYFNRGAVKCSCGFSGKTRAFFRNIDVEDLRNHFHRFFKYHIVNFSFPVEEMGFFYSMWRLFPYFCYNDIYITDFWFKWDRNDFCAWDSLPFAKAKVATP